MSPCQKYILSSDRDEKIRVSCYPQVYSIQSYCLGHTSFVTSILIPQNKPNILISGGKLHWIWFLILINIEWEEMELFEFGTM